MNLKPEALRLVRSLLYQHAARMRAELLRCDLTTDGRRYLAAEAAVATEAAAELEAAEVAL